MPCPEPDRWFELADPARRDPLELHLDACGDCRELVAGMAHAGVVERRAGSADAGSAGGDPVPDGLVPELTGRGARIDRYIVHGPIGAGAMGVVLAAYDPRLERTVALKLVRVLDRSPTAVAAARARLIGEAKAMARLAHPNVVAVHEVVEADGDLFIAMERVDGPDLATWLAEPRSRADRLRVVLDAGRGIAAAHAAGLVHRDIKPANILIGADGRARITDLGLAAAACAGEDAGASGSMTRGADPAGDATALADGSPAASRLVGTPGYLAPEVAAGAVADARADQYSFAVTATETLRGRGERAPDRAIGRVLARALAERAADRHPSMAVLVDRLERAARPRWPRYAVAALIVAAAALAAAWWYERDRGTAVARCDGDPTAGGVWTPARRSELAAALTGRDKSPDGQLAARVIEVVDARAAAWSAAVADVCTARNRGTQSRELADRRGACLEDQRTQLAAALDAIADKAKPGRALAAVGAVPLVAACAVPPASPPVTDDAVTARVRAELRAISALVNAGRFDDATTRMNALVPTVPAADVRLSADVAFRRADLTMRAGDAETALGISREALALAERAQDDAIRVDVMIAMVIVLDELGRITEARALLPLLEAAAARQLLDENDAARLEHALGTIAYKSGEYAESERRFRTALAVEERRFGPVATPEIAGTLTEIGSSLHAQGKQDEAREVLTRAYDMFAATVGPQHPNAALPLAELAALAFEVDDFDRSVELYEQVIGVYTAALGPDHPHLCEPIGHLGRVEWVRGNIDRALELQRQSLAMAERGFGEDHPLVAVSKLYIAKILEERGDRAGARELAEASVAIWEATGTVLPDADEARWVLARLLWADGARTRARALAETARAGYAALAPPYQKTAKTIAAWLAERNGKR